jgi:putative ABC transport system permease protein
MLRNYFKIALRTFYQNKTDTFINVAGLATGIAATILILLYVQFETSYDNFHADIDCLYRVSIKHKIEGQIEQDSPYFTPPLGPAMKANFPEIEDFTRVRTPQSAYFSIEGESAKISNILYADPSFLSMFNFPLLQGDKKSALRSPRSMILTRETAQRLFGSTDPVGKILSYEHSENFVVSGVIEKPVQNSHIQFDALISFSSLYEDPDLYLDWDGGNQYITYVRLNPAADVQEINRKLPALIWEPINKKYAAVGAELIPYLQPVADIHLYFNPNSASLRNNLYVFALISVIILLIACFNFINLTIARSIQRAKEIGIRKVLGASKKNICKQFILEIGILSMASVCIALFVVEMIFPVYRQLTGKQIDPINLFNFGHLAAVLGILIFVSLAAGAYPSLYLGRLPLLKSIKGQNNYGEEANTGLRNLLVIFQFSISGILIIATLIINQQLHFMATKPLGFDKDNMIVLPLETNEIQKKSDVIKNDLAAIPGVISVSSSSDVPADGFTSNGYIPEGFSSSLSFNVVDVDEDFLKTFGIRLISGRNFSPAMTADDNAYLINQTLADLLSWKSPIGKKIERNGKHQVIGVVSDFHFATLHDKIGPLIITNQPWQGRFNFLSVKIRSGDTGKTLSAIRKSWEKLVSAAPFNYHFLDERFDQLYKSEQKLELSILYFSILAIIIASLGLYALASSLIQRKIKEIGIRKVLGASASNVTKMVAGEYVKLVLIANLFAFPIAWFVMNEWLQNFAYRVFPGWWIFMVSALTTILIAAVTVSFKTIRAALTNPAEALRYE